MSKVYFSQTCSLPSILENSRHLLCGDLVKRALIRDEQHLIQINDLNTRATDLLTAKQCECMSVCIFLSLYMYKYIFSCRLLNPEGRSDQKESSRG